MVQSLEEYTARATQAYQPSQTAIQSQLDALGGQQKTAEEKINKNYALQQKSLNRQRNDAAYAASINAAANGAGFGGQTDIANRKYYSQQFIPAQAQLQTNQANELADARQSYENQRVNLNSQLANLQAEANKQALAQYYADLEAERQREAQLRAAAQQNSAQNAYYSALMKSMQNANSGTKAWDFGNGYQIYADQNGNAVYARNGQQISAGNFLKNTGANGVNWDLWNDVWNNGVSTAGVGSDTVAAISGSNANKLFGGSTKYKYLF